MADVNWQKVRELFDAALERPAAERAEWLAQVCGGDEALRTKVEQLLQAEDELEGFLETPVLAQLEEQPTREWTGQRVGAYQVVRELGRGGMGVVYLAERADGEFRKQVAIKLLPTSADEQIRQRFRRERQILADLEHPNIARLLDGGTLEGQPFVVMEFVPGRSLRERLRERGALPLEEINAIVPQICAGLAEAHERGIVHRDIKPENLIVAERHGQLHVTILDFGIAKLQQSTTTAQTQASTILGTPSYMSPEQAAGAGLAEIDARADVYSLGMVVYEMLTGVPAFRGDSYVSVLYQHQHARPVPPHKTLSGAAIPPAVSEVVLKALAKAPGERQQSARQLAEEFAQALERGASHPAARSWRNVALIAAAGLALVAGIWMAAAWIKRPAPVEVTSLKAGAEPVSVNSRAQLQYRIFKKTGAGPEVMMQSPLNENIVRPEDSIQFELRLPFSGACYLFYEGRNGKLFWVNPRSSLLPQRVGANVPLRVPETAWLLFEKDDPRNQIFIALFVPDGTPWSLDDVIPAEQLDRQLKIDAAQVNFPYARIPPPFAAELMKTLEEKARPANFSSLPIEGWYVADLPPPDGRRLITHKVELWHRLK